MVNSNKHDDEEPNLLEEMFFSTYNDENKPLVANGGGNQLIMDEKSAFDTPEEEDQE